MDPESPCASPEPILCSEDLEMEEEVCVFSENEDSISNVSPASRRDSICIGGGSDEDDIETEVEDEEEEDEEMGVPDENNLLHQTNPLDNPVILTRLFELSPEEDLADFRLVSKLWNQLSQSSWRSSVTLTFYSDDLRGPYGRILFWKAPLPSTTPRSDDSVPAQHPYLTYLQQFLCFVQEPSHEYASKPYRQFSLHEWELQDWNDQIEQFVQLCGPHITTLELVDCYFHDLDSFRDVLFKWFPNLRKLTLKSYNARWSVKTPVEPSKWQEPPVAPYKSLKYLEIDMNHEQLPISWMELFSMYPNIHTFKLYNADVDEAIEPMLNAIKIIRKHDPRKLQIKTLDILSASLYAQDRIPVPVCLLLREIGLPLESLTIDFGVDTAAEKVKELLQWLGGNLKTLDAYRGPISFPYQNFPFEVQLPYLQELTMSDRLAKTLGFLKWMPNLKRLFICDVIDDRSPLVPSEIVKNTKANELQGWKMEKCEELRFDYRISGKETLKLVQIMPNLERLRMPILEHEQFQVMCSGWGNTMRYLEVLGQTLDDAMLTGYGTRFVNAFNKAEADGKDLEDVGVEPIICHPNNIRNLQKLNSFTMVNDGNPTKLSACSVYHGFLKLPDLQYLHISAEISDKAYDAMKAKIWDCTVSRFPQEEEDDTMESWCDYSSDSESESE